MEIKFDQETDKLFKDYFDSREIPPYEWIESHDENGKWVYGKWLPDNSVRNTWYIQAKKDHDLFVEEFKKEAEYKNLLLEMIAEYQESLNKVGKMYLRWVERMNKDMADVLYDLSGAPKIEKKLGRLNDEYILKYAMNKEKITDDMIQRARDYPFERLIEVNSRGWAICPFHDDSKPSLWVKKNYGHCFGCNKTVDTIKLLMERDGLSFIQAVNYLIKL